MINVLRGGKAFDRLMSRIFDIGYDIGYRAGHDDTLDGKYDPKPWPGEPGYECAEAPQRTTIVVTGSGGSAAQAPSHGD